MKKTAPFLLSLLLFAPLAGASYRLDAHRSTQFGDPWKPLNPSSESAARPATGLEPETIRVLPSATRQTVEGFGASFNELGWIALNHLDPEQQDAVMEALFSKDGCRFTVGRMSIGANDFSAGYYSLNDHAFDYEMEHFSIERDRRTIIPYIKAAMKFAPDLRIWGSPWTPPIWMKQNRHYGGKAVNENWGQTQSAPMDDITPLNRIETDPRTLDAYAVYFRKYVEAYRAAGIDVFAVQPQNEVFANQLFPSCLWDADVMKRFLGEHLIPELNELDDPVEVWLGTINNDRMDWVDTVLESDRIRQGVEGIGVQWRGLDMLEELDAEYPRMKLMQTESECNNGSNDWFTAQHTYDLLHRALTNGVNTYMYWNMILDETGFSNWVWRQNSMISIDRFEKTVTYNPEFFVMKHFSHFVEPGAVRVQVDGGKDLKVMGFRNDDGSIAVTYKNPSTETQSVVLEIGDEAFSLALRPSSIGTVRLVAR